MPVLSALAVPAVVALLAVDAVVALPAVVALVAVAALPLMLIPHVPVAPVPDVVTPPRAESAALPEVAPVPPLAMGKVPDTCVVRLTPDSVPPRVRLPLEVTVPLRVMPLTEPVPPTELTVPLLVPTATPLTNRPAALTELAVDVSDRDRNLG